MTDAVTSGVARAPAMPFIMLTVFIDMLAVGLIIPVLPHWVGEFTATASEQAYWYGVISLAYGLANFVAAPVLGRLSDQFGRRPILLLGFTGFAITFFGLALANALWVFVVVRAVGGMLQANAAVANAYVADISNAEQRAKRFGMIGAMFGMGYMLGPVIGGILGDYDLHLPFYVAGTLAIINAIYGWCVLPESLPVHKRQTFDWRRAHPINALRGLAVLREGRPLLWVVALSNLAQFVLHMTWVLYCSHRFGWGPKENGWSLFMVGVMAVIVQGWLMRVLLKHVQPRTLVQFGLISSSVAYLAWGLATEGWMMLAVMAFNLLGFTVNASVQSLISNAAPDDAQGTAMGSVSSLTSAMSVVAPLMGAGLLGLVSHLPVQHILVGLPFFACAVLQVLAAFIAIRHFRQPSAASAVASA